ncbi:hypothetical protein N7451_009123 [Penicillium sp. IBT 35674x]|nr:hypothetical protein N7451_009123 [Penicillium sp. IBT 35674x]
MACRAKFDHCVTELLINDHFPERIRKNEVKKWISEAKNTPQQNLAITNWKPWSTGAVLATATDLLRLARAPAEPSLTS